MESKFSPCSENKELLKISNKKNIIPTRSAICKDPFGAGGVWIETETRLEAERQTLVQQGYDNLTAESGLNRGRGSEDILAYRLSSLSLKISSAVCKLEKK